MVKHGSSKFSKLVKGTQAHFDAYGRLLYKETLVGVSKSQPDLTAKRKQVRGGPSSNGSQECDHDNHGYEEGGIVVDQTDIGDDDDGDWEDVLDRLDNRTIFSRKKIRAFNRDVNRHKIHMSSWQTVLPNILSSYLIWDMNGVPSDHGVDEFSEIECIELFNTTRKKFPKIDGLSLLEVLARHGLLATSPAFPSTCISFSLLELFRVFKSRCPQFSMLAFVRCICDLQQISFRKHLYRMFSDAFDIYYEMHDLINDQLDQYTYVDTDAKFAYTCPACVHRTEDEPKLEYSMLVSMDGNESLKRVYRSKLEEGGRVNIERSYKQPRGLHFFLEREYVDVFKDEVNRKNRSVVSIEGGTEKQTYDDSEQAGVDEDSPCEGRWSSLKDDSKKRMMGIFDETGIFTTACRHGVVLFVCDMVQSGELSKYPLAMVNKLIDQFGRDIMVGYDVGCGFSRTAKSSPLVGPKVSSHNLHFCVNVFHGYAHCRTCQLDWHPLYTRGVGLEDFETNERIYSESNNVARCTRLASQFHRRQAISIHFKRWNLDRYAELSRFLKNNYTQALQNIRTLYPQLSKLKEALDIRSDNEFVEWHAEERQYLNSIAVPLEYDLLKEDYVRVLKKLSIAEREYSEVRNKFIDVSGKSAGSYSAEASRTNGIERRFRTLFDRILDYKDRVSDIEKMLGVSVRWVPSCKEWKEVDEDTTHREFREACKKLESLLVARLFELSKQNRVGTCYKLRRQIGKALNSRGAAIRRAVDQYNHAASALSPPQPRLAIDDVLKKVMLADLPLLFDSRNNITGRPWAHSAQREAATMYHKLQRSHEEIKRVDVEFNRLMDFIKVHAGRLSSLIVKLDQTNTVYAYQLRKRLKLWSALNDVHQRRFEDFVSMKKLIAAGNVSQDLQEQSEYSTDDEEETDDNVEAACNVLGSD